MINDALRLIRVYHNQTQTQISTGLGLSKSYVSEIESGRKKVTLETLEKYSRYFDIPASSLMLFAENIEDPTLVKNIKQSVAGKVVKMLDWIATISDADPEKHKD